MSGRQRAQRHAADAARNSCAGAEVGDCRRQPPGRWDSSPTLKTSCDQSREALGTDPRGRRSFPRETIGEPRALAVSVLHPVLASAADESSVAISGAHAGEGTPSLSDSSFRARVLRSHKPWRRPLRSRSVRRDRLRCARPSALVCTLASLCGTRCPRPPRPRRLRARADAPCRRAGRAGASCARLGQNQHPWRQHASQEAQPSAGHRDMDLCAWLAAAHG